MVETSVDSAGDSLVAELPPELGTGRVYEPGRRRDHRQRLVPPSSRA